MRQRHFRFKPKVSVSISTEGSYPLPTSRVSIFIYLAPESEHKLFNDSEDVFIEQEHEINTIFLLCLVRELDLFTGIHTVQYLLTDF